jgi:8-oxo-dGTP pyrophosphatase MutT (NUDIX family)
MNTETVAGVIDSGETAEEAIIRETLEETGYRNDKPELICKFFSSARESALQGGECRKKEIRSANREQRRNISCDDLGDPSNRCHHFS